MIPTQWPSDHDINDHKKTDKIALVTGGSRGIGSACVRALSAQGWKVAFCYRSQSHLAHELMEQVPGSQAFQADLSHSDRAIQLIKSVEAEMGAVDVLVNNAGMTIDKLVLMSSQEDLESIFNTNLRASIQLCKAVLKPMIKRKSGRIINITSIIGHTGQRGQSFYSASKAGLTAFTQSLAAECGRFQILCNCVAPGYITTHMSDQIPKAMEEKILERIHLNRPGTAEEVAHVIAFLASDQASYITGTTIHVNGGMAGF